MTKTGLFFISDYRDVTCEPGRDPSYWILKELDKNNKFEAYSTANKIIDSSCFENIDFLTLNYKRNIQIQRPMYNYRIYKAYKKVKDEVEIIHHCEMFQVGKGYNLIPILSGLEDKTFLIGPIELPHKVFEDDFLVDTKGFVRFSKKVGYHGMGILGNTFKYLFKKTIEHADKIIVPDEEVKKELSDHINHDKIEIINYGVNLAIYKKYKYTADEDNCNIIYAGSALERKGVRYLLEAIPRIKRQFPKVKLHLRTAGYKVGEYKRLSKKLSISENVVFYDKLEIEKYLQLLSKSRLQIGLQVEPIASEKLADAISKLFNDFELCKKFSENGLKKREKFDYAKVIPKYVELYEKYI